MLSNEEGVIMAYIKVDHAKLSEAASQMSAYISKHKNSMKKMGASVDSLSSSWKGDDYTQLRKEWEEIASDSSTSGNMIKSIQNHADSIKETAVKYKEAQARAINRANQLCK